MVRVLHVRLGQIQVLHRGIEPVVSEDECHFLDPHAVVEQVCGQRAAEAVRMDVLDAGFLLQLLQHEADPARRHPRRPLPCEERGGIVLPFGEVPGDHHAGDVAEVYFPLLRALAGDGAFHELQVDVRAVQGANLADPAAGGEQEVEDRAVACGLAVLAQAFDVRVGKGFSLLLHVLDRRDVRARILRQKAFAVQPAEERAVHGAVSFHGTVGRAGFLHVGQVLSDVEDGDGFDGDGDGGQEPADHVPVMIQSLLRTTFDLLRRKESVDHFVRVSAASGFRGLLDLKVSQRGGDDTHRGNKLIVREFRAESGRDPADQNGFIGIGHFSHLPLTLYTTISS